MRGFWGGSSGFRQDIGHHHLDVGKRPNSG
jgi:hypothetical protein